MKISELNDWLSLAANVGVIAGIVFLAFELQQNTEMMRAQTRDAITSKQLEFFLAVSSNEYVANAYFQGRRGEIECCGRDNPQWDPFTYLVLADLKIWENEFYQNQQGLFDEGEFEARAYSWSGMINRPGYRAIWSSNRTGFAEEFRALIDEFIEIEE